MIPHDHQLEQDLMELRPMPLSPAFKERLAAAVKVRPARRARPWRSIVMISACGLALSGLLAIFVLRPPAAPIKTAEPPDSGWAIQSFDGSQPTVWAFRQAVVEGAVEVDSLLDRHSASGAATPIEQPPRFSVSSFRTQLPKGEL